MKLYRLEKNTIEKIVSGLIAYFRQSMITCFDYFYNMGILMQTNETNEHWNDFYSIFYGWDIFSTFTNILKCTALLFIM